MENIILSGGWGYGNLGDDAILVSSVNMLKKQFPNAKIHILTYCVEESKIAFENDTNLYFYESLDRKLFGYNYHPAPIGTSKWDDFKYAISKRLVQYTNRTSNTLVRINRQTENFITENHEKLNEYIKLVQNCDLYLMSGGGYILDWENSVSSKVLEIYLAKKNQLKCLITGITYGPFRKKEIQILAERILKLADCMFVRDAESLKDISRVNAKCIEKVIPDIALREKFHAPAMKKNQIVLIPLNRIIEGKAIEICKNIKMICDEDDTSVLIVVAQLWYIPMNVACKFFYLLKTMGCNTEMIIPKNYLELQKILAESKAVISQNLHGLILAYRSNTPIICLNTARKFISFMELAGCRKQILNPIEISGTTLFDIFRNMDLAPENSIPKFAMEIDNSFVSLLNQFDS